MCSPRALPPAALALALAAAACAESPGVLRFPPPLAARAFVFSASAAGGEPRVVAGPIDALTALEGALAEPGVAFAIRYYDVELAALGLAPGTVERAAPGAPARALPTPAVYYVARAEEARAHGWVAGALAADPAASFRAACGPGQHDGGGLACAPEGACAAGHYLALDGVCVARCDTPSARDEDCSPYALVARSEDLGQSVRARLGDLDGDGRAELVATAYDAVYVYRKDGLGFVMASMLPLGDGVQAAWGLAVGDCDADGAAELVVGSWKDDLFVLSAAGGQLAVKGRIPREGYGNWTIEVVDVHAWPGMELLVSDRYGYFRALHFDGVSHVYHWTSPRIGQATNATGKTAMAGLGDTDGDGRLEVLTYSTLGLVDLWEAEGNAFASRQRFVFATSGRDGSDDFRAALGDGDGDGRDDVFYADEAGHLVGLRWDGEAWSERWRYELATTVTTMTVGDTDGDPGRELVLGTEAGRILVLDLERGETEELGDFLSPSRWVEVADLDGDGKDELLCGYDDGFFRVFRHR